MNIALGSVLASVIALSFSPAKVTAVAVEFCPADCLPSYDIHGSFAPEWTIVPLGAPGTGNEFCETCAPCHISILWSYQPDVLTRYKVEWQNGQGVRSAAGGAAGPAYGNFNYDMDCDFAFATQDTFSDDSGNAITGTPYCLCEI